MDLTGNKDFKFKLKGPTLAVIDWSNVHGWSGSLNWSVDPQKLFACLSSYPEIFDKRFYLGVDPNKKWSLELKDQLKNIGFNLVWKEIKWVPVEINKLAYFKKLVKELFDVLDNVKVTNSEIATKLYELRNKIELRLGTAGEVEYDGDGNIQGVIPAYTPEDQKIYNEAYGLIEELDEELRKLNTGIDNLQKNISAPVLKRKCDFDVEITRDTFNLCDNFEQLLLFSGDGDYAALVEDLISKDKKVIVVFAPGHKGKEYELLQEKLIKEGKNYALFICTVEHLRGDISTETNIPTDFSVGRDARSIANPEEKSNQSG